MNDQFRGLFAHGMANLFHLVAETTDEAFVGQQALHIFFGSRQGHGMRGGANQQQAGSVQRNMAASLRIEI